MTLRVCPRIKRSSHKRKQGAYSNKTTAHQSRARMILVCSHSWVLAKGWSALEADPPYKRQSRATTARLTASYLPGRSRRPDDDTTRSPKKRLQGCLTAAKSNSIADSTLNLAIPLRCFVEHSNCCLLVKLSFEASDAQELPVHPGNCCASNC